MSKQLGQTVYIENKGGGAGLPAMGEVARAARDGWSSRASRCHTQGRAWPRPASWLRRALLPVASKTFELAAINV